MKTVQEDDDFWKIALEDEPASNRNKNGIWDDDSDDDVGVSRKPVAYRLPTTDHTTLHLESLAASDGVWSPLGADAWYASALLATMVLTNDIPILLPSTKSVLELGSGAVGLSGLACAFAMARKEKMEGRHKVILTDNDPPVLEKLKLNAERNQDRILLSSDANKRRVDLDIVVQRLDWNEECDESFRHSIDLVIGSELVYTQETGEACSRMLEGLLKNSPHVDIWVVQVTDRYGWLDIVVPHLQSLEDVSVVSVPISSDTHTLASSLIPMGGTLDRHAYGAFRIHKRRIVN